MSEWSDLYTSTAILKKRLDEQTSSGLPSGASYEVGDSFECRLIPIGSVIGDRGPEKSYECYFDVGPSVKESDILEIDGHDYLVRSVTDDIAFAGYVTVANLARWDENADLS